MSDEELLNPSGVVWGKSTSGTVSVLDKEKALVRETYSDSVTGTDVTRTKVAIVGFSYTSLHLAPYADLEWSIWGMNQLYRHIPRADRWFEMHRDPLVDQVAGTDYTQWMKESKIPIYMLSASDEIPLSVAFPLDDIVQNISHRCYFTSSIAYMIALAIRDGFKEIAIYGVDLADDTEYFEQRPCAEYWLGVAEARGVKVYIHKRSALLKQAWLYGYENSPQDLIPVDDIQKRLMMLRKSKANILNKLLQIEGAEEDTMAWLSLSQFRKRGGELTIEEAMKLGHQKSHRDYDMLFKREAMQGPHGS